MTGLQMKIKDYSSINTKWNNNEEKAFSQG